MTTIYKSQGDGEAHCFTANSPLNDVHEIARISWREPEVMEGTPSDAAFSRLAENYAPPTEWYESEEEDLF